jgi:hypothetical protein
MAFNEFLADRVDQILNEQKANYYSKKMMGGLVFMVEDKMCCGLLYDKKKELDLLMLRIGEEAYPEAIKREGCHPMDFTGRPMKGYVFVDSDGYDLDEQLEYWISLALAYNPLAKKSAKRKK